MSLGESEPDDIDIYPKFAKTWPQRARSHLWCTHLSIHRLIVYIILFSQDGDHHLIVGICDVSRRRKLFFSQFGGGSRRVQTGQRLIGTALDAIAASSAVSKKDIECFKGHPKYDDLEKALRDTGDMTTLRRLVNKPEASLSSSSSAAAAAAGVAASAVSVSAQQAAAAQLAAAAARASASSTGGSVISLSDSDYEGASFSSSSSSAAAAAAPAVGAETSSLAGKPSSSSSSAAAAVAAAAAAASAAATETFSSRSRNRKRPNYCEGG